MAQYFNCQMKSKHVLDTVPKKKTAIQYAEQVSTIKGFVCLECAKCVCVFVTFSCSASRKGRLKELERDLKLFRSVAG